MMRPTQRHALAPHAGPYETWPDTSRLIVDGAPVETHVPGYVIDAQYDIAEGALLVTSFDCPFEESSAFVLLDARHRVVAQRHLVTPYASWLLDAHWPEDARTLVLHYQVGLFFRLTVMPQRGWWRPGPRLRLRRVRTLDDTMRRARDRLEARIAALREAGRAAAGR